MSNTFVVDNSVVMSWCFKDEANKYTDAVLDSLAESYAVVPSIWPLEVVNALLVSERRRRLSEADSIRFLTLLAQLPLTVEQEQSEKAMMRILALARKHKLSSYDASYLDLAMRSGLPIATLDKNLRAAAKRAQVAII
jgi:predicted nucleic acid-binding protein